MYLFKMKKPIVCANQTIGFKWFQNSHFIHLVICLLIQPYRYDGY